MDRRQNSSPQVKLEGGGGGGSIHGDEKRQIARRLFPEYKDVRSSFISPTYPYTWRRAYSDNQISKRGERRDKQFLYFLFVL